MNEKELKVTAIVLAILLLIATVLAFRAQDNADYYQHMYEASERGCTWSWDRYGDWTTCD